MSLPLLHAGKSAPGLSAALDLRFALDKSLTAYRGPTPSFSRASTGTYFNSSGVLTSASINTPRFDHTYNGTSWISRGLLVEEQRTNVVLNSANFTSGWTTANVAMATSSGTSPDGTNSAVKLYPTASTIQTRIYRSSTQSCISVFAKAAEKGFVYFYDLTGVGVCWFNLSTGAIGTNGTSLSASIVNCGNGWFRCSLATSSGTFSFFQIGVSDANGSTSSTASGTNGILIWGAQEEAGAFPTSYIPTTSASATRSADVCQITGGNFSSIWNGTEGSFAVEYDLPDSVQQDRGLLNANDGTNTKYVAFYAQSGSGQPGKNAYLVFDGPLSASIYGQTVLANTSTKMAACWKINDFALSVNGSAVSTDTSGTVPSGLDRLEIGKGYFGGDQIKSGHIARLRYYRKRLPNATLQQLST